MCRLLTCSTIAIIVLVSAAIQFTLSVTLKVTLSLSPGVCLAVLAVLVLSFLLVKENLMVNHRDLLAGVSGLSGGSRQRKLNDCRGGVAREVRVL